MPNKISFEPNPKPEDVAILENGIIDGEIRKNGHQAIETFAFFIRDDNNSVLGGCDGEIWCGCIYIRHLWVAKPLRGNGYGAKLMLSAENLASEKGCTFVAADTMDTDVVAFYQALGYRIEFERYGYLKDAILYYMRRDLFVK
jgi:ribosomal protein S18 acetylase RimI-like enzyme